MRDMAPIWTGIGQQLSLPSGHTGRLIGRLMALVNAEPNRLVIAAANAQPSDTVLELGFGPGRAIARLAQQVTSGRVLGIDHSSEMVSLATRANRRAITAGRVELSLGRFDALPYDDDSIDTVLATNVAYFFETDGDEIAEIHRVLRPAGVAVIYVSDRATMRDWKFSGPETHRLYDVDELKCLLRRGGFNPCTISIEQVKLSFGVRGLVATASKK